MDLKNEIIALETEVIQLRRDIHMHPELSTQEFRTAELVETYLQNLGIETRRAYNTGMIGLIQGGKPGKTILLRGDMDALPITEINDVPYSSQTPGVMHACGHDAHTAMLLVAAKVLMAHREELHGNVKLIFEPDEEVNGGAKFMVAEGALEDPAVDASFAMHVNPLLEAGRIGLVSGGTAAQQESFKILIKGKGGHTSQPEKCRDPILCAADVIQSVQMLQTRELSPFDTTVIMFGSICGGTANNIVPDTVELQGTMRYLYDASDKSRQPRARMDRLVRQVAELHRVEVEIEWEIPAYAVINHPGFVSFLNDKVIPATFGPGKTSPVVIFGGETFCEFVNRNNIPGALAWLGVGNPSIGADKPIHTPDFMIDEKALKLGVELHVRTAMEFLSANKNF